MVSIVFAFVFFYLAAFAGPAGVAHAACASTRDMAALNTRVLQTELMVAALTCDLRADYNAFANQFQQRLVQHGKNLRSMFSRTYGSRGNKQLNAFVTRLANDASQRSMHLRQGYCAFSQKLFVETSATPSTEFDSLLLKPWLRARHGFPPCAR